jgi:tetratricopeptide (TPR) repeat protein
MTNRNKNLIISLTVLAIFTGAFSLYIYRQKRTVGLYVYVRQGHSYVEDGKYEKGIKLLRKAYEEAPADKRIADYLIYGYLTYSNALDEEGKIDLALRLAHEAYGVGSKEIAVIEQLAYLYCRKAMQESTARRFPQAAECLEKGIDFASVFNSASKHISNYLFNMSVDAYNKDDYKTALLCIRASYALWNRYEALDFFGQIYYRKSDLGAAQFYWRKAKKIKPDSREIDDKLEMVHKAIAAKNEMENLTTQNFNITLYKEYGLDIGELKAILKKVYNEAGRDLDYYPKGSTPIVFYSENDFRDVFKQPNIVQAFYDGSIRLPVMTDATGPMLSALIAHEYAHAVTSILTDKKCPTWLDEGIACLEQSRHLPVSRNLLGDFFNGRNRLSIKIVQEGFAKMDDKDAVSLSYQGAYTAASFIVSKWGWPGLRGLLKRIRDGRHYANAIDEEFLISVETFEEMWNEYAEAFASQNKR